MYPFPLTNIHNIFGLKGAKDVKRTSRPFHWNIIAIGTGLKCKRGAHFLGLLSCGSPDSGYLSAIVLDLSFQVALWESRNISGNIVSPTIDGNYDVRDWYIGSFSLGLLF